MLMGAQHRWPLAAGRWPLARSLGATSALDARTRVEPAWNPSNPESVRLLLRRPARLARPGSRNERPHLCTIAIDEPALPIACCLHANGALQHPPSVIQSRLPKLDPDPEHVVPCPHAPPGVGKKGRAILLQHHNLLSAVVCLRPDFLGRLGRGRHWPCAVQEWLDWCAFLQRSRHVCNTDTALQATSHLP
jgi:hypothetical protein